VCVGGDIQAETPLFHKRKAVSRHKRKSVLFSNADSSAEEWKVAL
jgi:hypothetical protein